VKRPSLASQIRPYAVAYTHGAMNDGTHRRGSAATKTSIGYWTAASRNVSSRAASVR